MNFINCIHNKFLEQLFPKGLQEPVLLGQLGLDLADRASINIHVTQKPAIEINKWGVWGEDYNIIVIKLIGQFLSKIDVINWQCVDFCFLEFSQEDDIIQLNFNGNAWSVKIELRSLTFQGCDVYIK
ncbi:MULTISPECIES: hypothetical protein [unclassified Serratia (in: enterobacteria)]|uniref:hypothetical protein n=1 Tax=unclassified Serratia (in: enterobacteria) TaxID=2647522 RepID=UPI000505B2EB|nr:MULTISPECIES: hypothetical protein [unclassified Serratia (in: enterobacteria)]KFK96511.1 hypothetical protein JV45_05465 [Serratia sp. Ag2]KFK99986.1 hypothetical protein IV04_05345 [Serratia sp. Ag1]